MQINVIKRRNFGTDYYYPDCFKSRIFTEIFKRKTLKPHHFAIIRSLGFKVGVDDVKRGEVRIFEAFPVDDVRPAESKAKADETKY